MRRRLTDEAPNRAGDLTEFRIAPATAESKRLNPMAGETGSRDALFGAVRTLVGMAFVMMDNHVYRAKGGWANNVGGPSKCRAERCRKGRLGSSAIGCPV